MFTLPAPSRVLDIPEEAPGVEGFPATASNRLTCSTDDLIALRANWRVIGVVVEGTAAFLDERQPIHCPDCVTSPIRLALNFSVSD